MQKLVEVEDVSLGRLKLMLIPLDVTWNGKEWVGEGADALNEARERHKHFHPESDCSHLTWPKRVHALKLDCVRVELGDRPTKDMEGEDTCWAPANEWPEAEVQQRLHYCIPYRLIADVGGRVRGDLLVEVQ